MQSVIYIGSTQTYPCSTLFETRSKRFDRLNPTQLDLNSSFHGLGWVDAYFTMSNPIRFLTQNSHYLFHFVLYKLRINFGMKTWSLLVIFIWDENSKVDGDVQKTYITLFNNLKHLFFFKLFKKKKNFTSIMFKCHRLNLSSTFTLY